MQLLVLIVSRPHDCKFTRVIEIDIWRAANLMLKCYGEAARAPTCSLPTAITMARRRGAGLRSPSSSSLTTYRLAYFTDRNGPERSSHLPRHYSSISPDPSDEESAGYTSAPRLKLAPLSTEPFIHDAPDLRPTHATQAQVLERACFGCKVLPGHLSDELDQRVDRRRPYPRCCAQRAHRYEAGSGRLL